MSWKWTIVQHTFREISYPGTIADPILSYDSKTILLRFCHDVKCIIINLMEPDCFWKDRIQNCEQLLHQTAQISVVKKRESQRVMPLCFRPLAQNLTGVTSPAFFLTRIYLGIVLEHTSWSLCLDSFLQIFYDSSIHHFLNFVQHPPGVVLFLWIPAHRLAVAQCWPAKHTLSYYTRDRNNSFWYVFI